MVKAGKCWPRPQHVAWQYPYLNCFGMPADPSLLGLPACLNCTTCIFPAVNAFQGLAAPAIPSLKTEPTNGVQEFLQHRIAETSLKGKHTGGPLQNANPESLQKKLLIFDHSGNKTRIFYGPVLPLVQSPIVSATKFPLACDINEGPTNNGGQRCLANYSLPEESDKDHVVHEESEMHEDTEEINALLYSDDDDFKDDDDDDDDDYDEVTSTDRSPLVAQKTHVMQEQFQNTKEGVASSDWPNKRLKLVDGGYNRSSQPVYSSSSIRLNENGECVSDAESKYSGGQAYSTEKTKVGNSTVGDIRWKRDKIRESLRVLENLIPGAKGKKPLLVIDETIEYLTSLASQTDALGVKYH